MKRFLFAGSVLVAGLILAGCQARPAVTGPNNTNGGAAVSASLEPQASPVTKASPVVKATPVSQSVNDKDLKAIDDQLNKLDTVITNDFPTFTEGDF